MDVKEAVFWLLDFAGVKRCDETMDKKSLRHQVKSDMKKEEKKIAKENNRRENNKYLLENWRITFRLLKI